MPWLRVGDKFATHPRLMAVFGLRATDERSVNEVAGFVVRLSAQSASFMTDYSIDLGTAQLLGGSRTQLLLRQAVQAGLLTEHGQRSERHWKIAEDTDLVHMRSKAEVEWDRQRHRDVRNPRLTVPVRQRDGDACRYCNRSVNWSDRRGARGATYDHTEPGTAASIDTFVVSCGGCNSAMGDMDTETRRARLLPPPLHPLYGSDTIAYLDRHGVTVPQPARPGSSESDTAAPRARAESTDSATATAAGPRARTESTDSATATTAEPARPGSLEPGTAAPARPASSEPGTAAPRQTRPEGHDPDNAFAQRGTDPPPEWATGAEPSPPPDQLGLYNFPASLPGRVGTGRGGEAASTSSSGGPVSSARRGRRGRRRSQ